MSKKIAFLFPGQGSQYVGMGRELAEQVPEAREIFRYADQITHRPVSRYCFEGPLEELTLTMNLQPAVTAVNLACLKALAQAGIEPAVVAGHSLGEYAALVAAGVLSFFDALTLVNKRGELMHRESLKNPGKMAAILGLDISEVEDITRRASQGGVLAVANHNTAEQIVISGEEKPLEDAIRLVKEKGKKAIPLKVSGAWHCSLMEEAVGEFRTFMDDITFKNPRVPVLFNATAQPATDPQEIKDLMAHQLVRPVKWYDIVVTLLDKGVDVFVEVGPKAVLSGLCKKIVPPGRSVQIYNVEDSKTLSQTLEALK